LAPFKNLAVLTGWSKTIFLHHRIFSTKIFMNFLLEGLAFRSIKWIGSSLLLKKDFKKKGVNQKTQNSNQA